ncbi:hypothetical protein [Moheibacter sediminis]|uniref:Uncharacterized protein n=1 Tax=Moheibacter sediminis TaxID=1434700 RepID=A0A1W2BEC6_9FLAO|nr:hypothetical protein [Moheibacter sediminis]SMC71246.1 hypothetical protein SAMN06296427_106110 [Moheibacter sediminis]
MLVKVRGDNVQTYLIHYPDGIDFENHTTRTAIGEEIEPEAWGKSMTCYEVIIFTVSCDDTECEYGWGLIEVPCGGGGGSSGGGGSGNGTGGGGTGGGTGGGGIPTGPIGFPPADGGGGGGGASYNTFLNLLSPQQLQWLNQPQNALLRSQLYTHLVNNNYSDQSINFAIDFVIFCEEEGDPLQKLKQAIAGGITTTAEYTHKIFKKFSTLVSQYPSSRTFVNTFLQGLSNGVSYLVNKNPDTCSFADLFNMWLFELGPHPININGLKVTTNQLKNQEGVNQARAEAILRIQTGTFLSNPIVNHEWSYGQGEFYDGMQNGNFVTAFLGSYSTKITTTQISNGYQLYFEVSNTSGWESATRFRIDNDGINGHDGIFPNTYRHITTDIRLGGNFTQNWSWTEIIN